MYVPRYKERKPKLFFIPRLFYFKLLSKAYPVVMIAAFTDSVNTFNTVIIATKIYQNISVRHIINKSSFACEYQMIYQSNALMVYHSLVIPTCLSFQQPNRVTKDGDLIMASEKTRKQILNQADCLEKIRHIIFQASTLPKELTPEQKELIKKRYELSVT